VRLQRKVAGIKEAHVSSASVELVPMLRPRAVSASSKNFVELTNDPFDDVEIREFGAVTMKTGCRPPNTLRRAATAKRTWWSFVPSVIADQIWR
jgi:hypothetical protein